MRKLLFVAVLASLAGCQTLGGMFGGGTRSKREPIPAAPCPDPLLSPDIDEQQRYGRSRYAYPDADRNAGPPVIQDRPSPSGR
jgi:hypothetical protein